MRRDKAPRRERSIRRTCRGRPAVSLQKAVRRSAAGVVKSHGIWYTFCCPQDTNKTARSVRRGGKPRRKNREPCANHGRYRRCKHGRADRGESRSLGQPEKADLPGRRFPPERVSQKTCCGSSYTAPARGASVRYGKIGCGDGTLCRRRSFLFGRNV